MIMFIFDIYNNFGLSSYHPLQDTPKPEVSWLELILRMFQS